MKGEKFSPLISIYRRFKSKSKTIQIHTRPSFQQHASNHIPLTGVSNPNLKQSKSTKGQVSNNTHLTIIRIHTRPSFQLVVSNSTRLTTIQIHTRPSFQQHVLNHSTESGSKTLEHIKIYNNPNPTQDQFSNSARLTMV